jgi:large subunit ribosomal protein L30
MSKTLPTLVVKQIKSAIRRPKDQEATLRGLGLRRIGHERRLVDTPQVRGMVAKIHHLVIIVEEGQSK